MPGSQRNRKYAICGTCPDFLLMTLGVLTCQVTKPKFPTASSGFVLFAFWLLMAMILSSVFKGNLLARLVAVDYDKPIRNTQV